MIMANVRHDAIIRSRITGLGVAPDGKEPLRRFSKVPIVEYKSLANIFQTIFLVGELIHSSLPLCRLFLVSPSCDLFGE
jgi:hypothetical protein